jgi:hypothetical protein
MQKSVRAALSDQAVDLRSFSSGIDLRPTGSPSWDLALGGVIPGITRVLGPRSFEYALSAVAADPNAAGDCVVVAVGKPPRVTANLVTRVGLHDSKILTSNDCNEIVESVRREGWRYAIIDRSDLVALGFAQAQDLDNACAESGCVLLACSGFDSSHAARVSNSPWSYCVQAVRLVPEVPSHANGVFDIRVIENPFATDIASESVVRVRISGSGRITLVDSEEGGDGALLLEII